MRVRVAVVVVVGDEGVNENEPAFQECTHFHLTDPKNTISVRGWGVSGRRCGAKMQSVNRARTLLLINSSFFLICLL